MTLKAAKLKDIVPIAEFKSRAGPLLDRMQKTGEPIVITKNGKAAGVIVSPEEYDRIQYTQGLMASVARGMADLKEGRVMDGDELEKSLVARVTKKHESR